MYNIEDLYKKNPYSFTASEKLEIYKQAMNDLTQKHMDGCRFYRNLIKNTNFENSPTLPLEEYPFLPVRMFKLFDLCSVPEDEIVKTMTSSGTTGQRVSKIFLNRTTSANQTKALTKISSDFLGTKRLPMLIIDSKSVLSDRNLFSARGAGILGYSMLGHHVTYALDENMNLDMDIVLDFLKQFQNQEILLFGFTYIIWEHFYKTLFKRREQNKVIPDFSKGILIHGGGFKKMIQEAVDNDTYKNELKKVCGIEKVYNYYGMVEQTGSVFMECECGNLHASVFSDVIIRNFKDLSVCGYGEKGFIQLISLLPDSYPGHSILTEDIGEIIGEDCCPCKRKGKIIKIHGRIQKAEIRGCSDTYETKPRLMNQDSLLPKYAKGNFLSEVRFLSGNHLPKGEVSEPYSERSIEFINQLSIKLMNHKQASIFPDILTLAFWCRNANIRRLKHQFEINHSGDAVWLGRGIIFHIAPSNVPINFMFSYLFGVLSGNANIVRLPSKDAPQIQIICDVINEVLLDSQFAGIRENTLIVSYERNDFITQSFLALADGRVIWGGDETISHIRALPAKPKSVELVFADRYSVALLNPNEIIAYDTKKLAELAHNFYIDTYLMDQNACSTPHLIFWMKTSEPILQKAKKLFFDALQKETEQYKLQPIMLIDKYTEFCKEAMGTHEIDSMDRSSSAVFRIKLKQLPEDITLLRGRYGMFYEYDLDHINQLKEVISSKVQSFLYAGVDSEELKRFITDNCLIGIDRIVPLGKSLDMGVYWDGYDIIGMLSRRITIS